ncbi:aldo/keto reductase [Leuconostoc carnosum]|uniref:aldo/keto reductase n=1 Tax=Leuconostoc TaxID=1243 RepID=UPI000D50F305|nr:MULTISPECIES: aldo/keto reductase [Leuconostoc]KAA8324518.1 aldo/keto reductase [Leuconostoc carnosum]KAA8358191.1 aldo/keto reductase [Leuconostoc carnosum]KAA8364689.1 aldo/keto reductase [Leuconostoc carnosum]KAA8365562.1 aldo/keto reductase [Leuconostoc carnosum]KAA8371590.1 aldo/keto reductase [Leuconostoc carnosum]
MSLTDTYTLNNGVKIPVIGFGTWQSADGDVAYQAVKWALEAGYRHIDTAAIYGNEQSVGRAIKDSGIAREDLFITTKLWNDSHSYDATNKALETSLNKLGIDYVDLYLIHWPNPHDVRQKDEEAWEAANADTWRAFEAAYQAGKAKAIGVSNFQIHHLEALAKTQKIAPMVNQNFLNPSDGQAELVAYNTAHGMLNEAYSPLGTGKLINLPQVNALSEKYGKSVPQILIRWSLEKGFLPLPKSTHKEFIEANANVFDFSLTTEEVDQLDKLSGVNDVHTDADKIPF